MKKWSFEHLISFLYVVSIILVVGWGSYQFWLTQHVDSGPDKLSVIPLTQGLCWLGATTQFDRDWMRACHVEGFENNPECGSLFDSNGYYLPIKNAPSSISHTKLLTLLGNYHSDMNICACNLPDDVAKGIDDKYLDASSSCSQYPVTFSTSTKGE